MKQWYVKELSKLTKITVQTLHHYDRIGLLKPSVRLDNNYRLYSEKDLLKLQQIIALKFFGFELSKIKNLLDGDVNMLDHFTVQLTFLEEKANALMAANHALKNVLSDCQQNKSLSWESIIQTIEVYRMTQQLEKTWKKILSADELKQLAAFHRELESRSHEKIVFEKNWHELVSQINANLNIDPASEIAASLAQRCIEMVNSLYGAEYKQLQRAVWEKGFLGGHVGVEHGLSDEAVAWLDKAMHHYHTNRVGNILDQIGKKPDDVVLKKWNALLDELCGKDTALRSEFLDNVTNHAHCTQSMKAWLIKTKTR